MVEDREPSSTDTEPSAIGTDLAVLLHRRVSDTCIELYKLAHYKVAAQEALTQVELALREKSLAPRKYHGRGLIDYVFGEKSAVALSVPFGGHLQTEARSLFRAAFGYYRNYAVHDGANISPIICARILVLASELLDLLDVSPRCLRIEGGPEGLVEHGYFANVADFRRFLEFIDGRGYPEETWDGLLEDLALADFDWAHITLVQDLGLLNEKTEFPGDEERDCTWWTAFELTEHGRTVLRSLR